jgi:hypothetical protein
MSPNPPTGTATDKVRMIFVVNPKGIRTRQKYIMGTMNSTVSMRLRTSNNPSTFPASVKFGGIT